MVRPGADHNAVVVDPATGVVYQSSGVNSNQVKVYANSAAFAAGTVQRTVSTSTSLYGPYFTVNNGVIYGRTGSSGGAQLSSFSAATGAVLGSTTIADMGGTNGSDTFNWGGYSGVNAMNSGNGLYVVGGAASGVNKRWTIASLDYSLGQQRSVSFDLLTPAAGYAFAVNGYVFFGDSYNSLHISQRVEAATGAVVPVDFTLSGLSPTGAYYIDGASYDSRTDALYLSNYARSIGKADNLAQQLGVQRSAVPEPGTLAVFGMGLAALGLARRRGAASK